MPRKETGFMPSTMPGPKRRGTLPATLPAGEFPPEDSRLWNFTPKSIVQGENWIQDDTREWFEDQDRKVVIGRSYPTHPRWMVTSPTMRTKLMNDGIISEIHMLARISAGLPEFPAWVPARLTVKQLGADLNFRLTKATRQAWLTHGARAMQDFAERAPGQFVKFVASTFIPKQIEQNVTVNPGQTMTPEQLDLVLQSVAAEMDRRKVEAQELLNSPMDYEPLAPAGDALKATAERFHRSTGDKKPGHSRRLDNKDAAHRLRQVIDLEADVTDTGEFQWE